MIDFQNASFVKLKPVPDTDFTSLIQSLFTDQESVVATFRGTVSYTHLDVYKRQELMASEDISSFSLPHPEQKTPMIKTAMIARAYFFIAKTLLILINSIPFPFGFEKKRYPLYFPAGDQKIGKNIKILIYSDATAGSSGEVPIRSR